MSTLISADSISEVWLAALRRVHSMGGGREVHVAMAVSTPGLEYPSAHDVLDKTLIGLGRHEIDTVAETIFPSCLYPDPGLTWEPGLPRDQVEILDDAAGALYENYIGMLPIVLSAPGNLSGTYFSRMVSWPGKKAGGTNQLELRIARLRSELSNGRQTNNTLDVDVAADALDPDGTLAGVQVYAVLDKRTRGFPCLTHIDLTLLEGRLHCTAVYRHQYLVEKAYGNLVGLSALMAFLCQQGGCEMGELMVHATLADAQPGLGKGLVSDLIDQATAALKSEAPQ